ncbi:MAG: hypothetical protein HQ477_04610 [Chloroflexi bacterium]|nr:hypothetical protein [Chloroflexota bacterium]
MKQKVFIVLLLIAVVQLTACGAGVEGLRDDTQQNNEQIGSNISPRSTPILEPPEGQLPGREHGNKTYGIWPQIWSQHAHGIQSWEYKVNCGEASSHTDPCFLSNLTSVAVTTPAKDLVELEKDFNTNEFSGEITRRWVRYGPPDGDLPERGKYVYTYSSGSEVLYEQVIPYDSGVISFPTDVEWKHSGNDILVMWNPPSEASNNMHHKALIWQVDDTPELFISEMFDWNANTAVLRDVSLIVGGKYSLNVAIYFDDGYAYSEYVIFEWPEPGDTGD